MWRALIPAAIIAAAWALTEASARATDWVRDLHTRRWDRKAARIHAAQDAAHARLIADLTNLGERVRAQAEWDKYWESVVREPTPLHDELSAQMLRAELDDPQAVAMWLGGAS